MQALYNWDKQSSHSSAWARFFFFFFQAGWLEMCWYMNIKSKCAVVLDESGFRFGQHTGAKKKKKSRCKLTLHTQPQVCRTKGYKLKVFPGQKRYRSLLKSWFLIVCRYRPWQENKQHWDFVNRPSCKLVARRSSQVSRLALLIL